MRIGLSICSSYPGAAPRSGAAFMIERARAAADADLDSLFVGDHHVTPIPYYQNTAMLGRLLAEWGEKPAGALYLLPLWHPVLLAEQVATLASIARGRFVLQCALGGDPRQAAAMSSPYDRRAALFEASLTLLRRLWAGETVTESEPWPIEEARISPAPPEPVEVWIGAQAPVSIRRAARMGEGWLATAGLPEAQAAKHAGWYRQACAEVDRTPTAMAIRKDIYVGRDSAAARRVVQPYIDAGYRGFPEEALVYGSEAEVADAFARLGEMGYTDVIVRNISIDQAQCLETIERLGRIRQRLAS